MWIERPDIESRLQDGVRVFSVVAGPGYGKTVLAARLFSAWSGSKLWYSLDAGDADLAVFATHLDSLVRALGGLREFDGETWRLASPKDIGSLYAEGVADLASPPLFVFDDVHVLDGSRALPALGEFVERAARVGATFVLCGRFMPLSLHSFAAAAQLASVGVGDLAFRDSETRSYLERANQRGSDGTAIAELTRRAEGWPAGIALIASTASGGGGPTTAPPSARDEHARQLLFEYLAEEALGGLSELERGFLLETAILDQLEVGLCDAVLQTTRSSEVLASLAKRGLFVSRRSDDAYTYHQLFREFLRETLVRTRPADQVAALHGRISDALAERGDVAGSIAHRFDAGDDEAAAAALEEAAPSLLRVNVVAAVGTLLPRVQAARIERSPALLMALGRVQRERGDWDAALATLERAILGARASGSFDVVADSVRYCASILASRGEFERLRGMLDDALALGTLLSDESVTTLRMTLAAVYIEIDRFEDALAIFREITPSVIARGDYASQGSVLHNTAVAHLRRGDLYAGQAMYERALKLKRGSGQRVSSLLTLGDLVYTKTLLDDLDEADRLCDELLREAHDVGNNAIVAHAHENQGVLRLQRGDFDGAARAFAEAFRACDPGDVLVMPDIQHGLAQCALERGDVSEADELCSTAIGTFRGAGKQQQVAPILLTRARVLAGRGDSPAAYAVASEAIDAAGKGADAVLQAMTCLDAAAFLVGLATALPGDLRGAADQRAAAAATSAVALLHQRDYRFLLRTKAAAFATLRDHLRRWNVGLSLVPEIGERGSASELRIEMLGGLRVLVGGHAVPPEAWKRRKARDILAYLVSLRGRSVTRARLVDLHWPDADADAAHDNLRVTISAVRKAVGDVVRFEANGYRFVPPPGTVVDTEAFDDDIDAARQAVAHGDVDAARRCYGGAAQLYRGEFLEDMEEGGWQWHERERLRAACLEALRWLAADQGDPASARLALERLLEVAPFDLDAVKMRLDALVREMRLGEARRHYDDWRARYRAAVGADAPDVWNPEAVTA
jgi:DNA-binding SARP family transcriptional activator/uncharacterized protein HemY